MKKNFIFLLLLIIFFIVCFIFFYKKNNTDVLHTKSEELPTIIQDSTSDESNETVAINKPSVTYNGWLHVDGYKLKNQHDEDIQLRGLSSHGIEWFGDVITLDNLSVLQKDWNINVFRIALYTDSNSQGYVFNQQEDLNKVYEIVDMALDLDIYVIIDWHILDDNNPQIHIEEAKNFFNIVSKKYSNVPNVLYEICNEPNGNDVTWENSIKPFAEEIIPVIRNNSKNSIIIVGTPDWCKKIDKAADNPLNYENIVYSCHFYSGTHGSELREKIDYCIERNIPIFISECGLTDSTGNGDIYFESFKEWINYLNSKNISWVYWSFSNKDESSAILSPNYPTAYTSHNYNDSESSDISDKNTDIKNTQDTIKQIDIEKNDNDALNNFDDSSYSNEQLIDLNDYLTESGNLIKSIFKSYSID